MITLEVRTPVGRAIHTNGHRGKSFFITPCNINVFAGTVLLETLDAGGQVDFRAVVTAREGVSPVIVHLQKVTAAPKTPTAAPKTQPKPRPKTPSGARRARGGAR